MKSNTGQTIRRLKAENKKLRIGIVSQQRELLLSCWKASASYYQTEHGQEAPDFDEWFKSNCG